MVTTPAMLSDLIRRLALGRVDLHVVAEFSDREGLSRNLQTVRPDVVVIGLLANETDATVRSLRGILPRARFVALSADGRTAFGYAPYSRRITLSDTSPQAFVDFIGGASGNEI